MVVFALFRFDWRGDLMYQRWIIYERIKKDLEDLVKVGKITLKEYENKIKKLADQLGL